ncbi:MAG: Ig-like domain-containing protein [Gemmatimonadales bacterium]
MGRRAASVVVTPDSVSIGIGRTIQMLATIRNSAGDILTDRAVTWESSDAIRATVSDSGLVSARSAGQVSIHATADSVSGASTLIVLTPVASVVVSPQAAILVPGGSLDFTVELHGPLFEPLSDRFVTWSIGDSLSATVSSTGQVQAVQVGAATLSAHSEGVSSNPVAVSVIQPEFYSIASGPGANHTCALTGGGTAFCWGFNYEGELGIGVYDRDQGLASGKLLPAGIASVPLVFSVTAGSHFTCGLSNYPYGGLAYCWGGVGGELGNGSLGTSALPALVQTGLLFSSVSSGTDHTCAIATDSAAYCWGRPPGIGTGNFPSPQALTPVGVDGGLKFRILGTGTHLTCGLSADSLAYCWGNTIGNDTASAAPGPHAVSGGLRYVTLTVGDGHACGIATDWITFCWGRNSSGQLGNGSTDTATAPVMVSGGNTFVALTVGFASSCGLTATGNAYCWGQNTYGQLGSTSGETCTGHLCSTTPIPVSGGLQFQALASGAAHVCGLTLGRVAHCWGANNAGQLGDGTRTNRAVPTRVLGQP